MKQGFNKFTLVALFSIVSLLWGTTEPNWPESDHNCLFLKGKGHRPAVVCLNVSQAGNLKLFGKSWITTLRTKPLLSLVNTQQESLFCPFTNRLLMIVNGEGDVQFKNKAIEDEVNNFLPALNKSLESSAHGISVVAYEASKAFNPKVDTKELKTNPGAFVQCPTFLVETADEFRARMIRSINKLKDLKPGLIFAQEVDLGRPPFDFPITELEESYGANIPQIVGGVSNSCAVTFFDKQRFCLDANHITTSELIQEIVQAIFDQTNNQKINVTPLHDTLTGNVVYACNIHADYMKTNTTGKQYDVLACLCEHVPGLILAGDWNVQKKNEAYWAPIISSAVVDSVMDVTPEDETQGGNPTWDGIFVSKVEPREDAAVFHFLKSLQVRLIELKAKAFNQATEQQQLTHPSFTEDQIKEEAEKVAYSVYAGMLGEVILG